MDIELENAKFKTEENIGILTITRPKALNALNGSVMDDLEQFLDKIALDTEIRVMIITGEGRSFVAGADISTMKSGNYDDGKFYGKKGSNLFRKIELLDFPVIAAVNGFCLGGGNEMMLACDFAIASEKAKFGQPEVGLGITPGFGGTQRLPRKIGIGMAKKMIYSADIIGAKEAERIGLVEKVVSPEELMGVCLQIAKTIASKAPISVKYSKKAINEGLQTDIESGVAIENELFASCFSTEDQKEGMASFLEKKKPIFQNK